MKSFARFPMIFGLNFAKKFKMENPISISNLNDFIFCPLSIYFHGLFYGKEKTTFQQTAQTEGTIAHESIDKRFYSNKKVIKQGISVYSEELNICGKIDLFNMETNTLIERKNNIIKIYDGYIFQVYAQYYCLIDMGYNVNNIKIYAYRQNKTYDIPLPDKDKKMKNKFFEVLRQINEFDYHSFYPKDKKKCDNCIYSEICDRRLI